MEEVRPDDGKISMFRHRTARSPKECVVRALAHLHRLPYGGNIIFRVTPIWGMSAKGAACVSLKTAAVNLPPMQAPV
jgi:hypothetical protein